MISDTGFVLLTASNLTEFGGRCALVAAWSIPFRAESSLSAIVCIIHLVLEKWLWILPNFWLSVLRITPQIYTYQRAYHQ
ncbi:hypothetical protein ALT1545_150010 [Alteromonas macleodii]